MLRTTQITKKQHLHTTNEKKVICGYSARLPQQLSIQLRFTTAQIVNKKCNCTKYHHIKQNNQPCYSTHI